MAENKADHQIIEFTSASADVSGWTKINAKKNADSQGNRAHRCARIAVTSPEDTADDTVTIGFALTDGSEVYNYIPATCTVGAGARRTGLGNSSGQYFMQVVLPDRHGGTDTIDLNGGHKSGQPQQLEWRVGLAAESIDATIDADNPVTVHLFFDEDI